MPLKNENVYVGLKRIFHEPSRLAIMSALCREVDGLTFNELKEECELTFGNLSSHLKSLQDAKAIKVKKFFIGNKPCTRLSLTEKGRQSFVDYLEALEEVLNKAADAVSTSKEKASTQLFSVKPVFEG